ncbi:MAG: hypothetical protein IKD66_14445 [Solobacterium sp.]|nr:hypothetical protein [Solobacterium sp.]
MKTLDELYKSVKSDKAVRMKFTQAMKDGKIDAFLKENDCSASVKDAMAYLRNVKSGALAEDDLENVAGGCMTTNSCNPDSCYSVHCTAPVS